jgi:hypothetical protein
MTDRIAFRIKQNGQVVARVEGRPLEAEAEILHYAKQYRADGELTIQHNGEGYWKRFMLMCQWPIPEPRHEP